MSYFSKLTTDKNERSDSLILVILGNLVHFRHSFYFLFFGHRADKRIGLFNGGFHVPDQRIYLGFDGDQSLASCWASLADSTRLTIKSRLW